MPQIKTYLMHEPLTGKQSFYWFQRRSGIWWRPDQVERQMFGNRFEEFFELEFSSVLDLYLENVIDDDIPYWLDLKLENVRPFFRQSIGVTQKRNFLFLGTMALIFAPKIHINKYEDWFRQMPHVPYLLPCRCIFCEVKSESIKIDKNLEWKNEIWGLVDDCFEDSSESESEDDD